MTLEEEKRRKELLEKVLLLPFGASEEVYEKVKKEHMNIWRKQGYSEEEAERKWEKEFHAAVRKATEEMLQQLKSKTVVRTKKKKLVERIKKYFSHKKKVKPKK